MKSLISALLLVQSDATTQEETSLMQGLVARRGVSTDVSSHNDHAAKLMETATKMLKNGVTPDVVQFIETTIQEVNGEVLGRIVDEHHRDQGIIDGILADFDAAIAEMEACADSVRQQHVEREESSHAHKVCRSDEAITCARSRKCEEELEELWQLVKLEEDEMRRIHWAIHGEWCEGSAPGHPPLNDPFQWQIGASWEGPETSQSTDPYPAVDLAADVIEFRRFSVEYFGLYIEQKPRVEMAWENYNRKLLECAALEETWTLKVDECDEKQDTLHGEACAHGSANRQCAATFGHRYHMTMVEYTSEVARIRELEYDRKREWETLHIVTCLLETVYTHVIHSIDSGEPCPTIDSNPDQTAAEINVCHVIEESMTANLTIDYGTPPTPPELPPIVEPPCTAQYIYDETGSFSFELQASHSQAIADEGLESYFTVLSAFGWAGCAAPKACTPCSSTDLIVNPDYVEHSGCDFHQAHMHPGQMDMDTFKCLTGDQCIRAEGRCNGANNCDDGSDEQGCDTHWGVPAVMGAQECQDPFVSDVQFQCSDNTCTDIAGRCNGVNNCADGSDEQGCATTTTGLTIEAMTGYTATIETPAVSSQVFYDRTYTFSSLGAFTGHSFIKMSNEDKHIRNSHVQMKLRLPAPMTIYVNKLETTEMSWLQAEGWTHSGLEGVSYQGVRQTRHTDWSGNLVEDHYGPSQVWEKTFPAGVVTMRGNNGGDGSYVMFVANAANAPEEPEPTVCPAGWTQVGEAGADIGGCGLQSCGERYWSQNPTECAAACAARADCLGFNYAPMGGDRNHEAMTVCTLYNAAAPTSTWWGSAGHVQIFCVPESAWTMGVALTGSGGTVATDIGQAEFNRLFNACPVVKYTRNGGVHSVYTRRAGRAEIDAFSIFTYRWASSNNQLGTDFDIYNSEADARSGSGAWNFCNYDDPDVGYPRDCGPNGNVNNQWFTMPSSGQHDSNSGGGAQRFDIRNINSGASFEIYTGADCPAHPTGTTSDGCRTSNYVSGENPTTAQDDPDATAAIRCCSEAGNTCQTQDLPGSVSGPVFGVDGASAGVTQACINSVTFSEAQAICAEAGRRLCTASELDGGVCCGTGCWHDHRAIWVSN